MEGTTNKKKTIAWIIRFIIFGLFVLSAVTKMFPLWSFEKQLVDLGICSWEPAYYLARLIIAVELALGIAILVPHLIKKLIIPATIALLVAFCGHLIIQMIQYGPMNGNCGCFGELIPMTPLEAFIKNVLTIGLLVWLYRIVDNVTSVWKDILYPAGIFTAAAIFMFIAFPKKEKTNTDQLNAQVNELQLDDINGTDTNALADNDALVISTEDTATTVVDNTIDAEAVAQAKKDSIEQAKKEAVAKATAAKKDEPVKKEAVGPAQKVSKFAAFAMFNNKKVNVDQGKKVLCMFAPGCDHCQNTAKMIGELAKTNKIPEVYIYFMDEEVNKIPEFFKIAGVKYPFQVLGIGDFWDLLGSGSTPGVFCQWNGNTMQSYEGINDNEFNFEKFKEFAVEK